MRAFVLAALVLVAVSALEPWEMQPLEKLDPINFTITNCGDPNTDLVVIKSAVLNTPMPVHEGDYLSGSFDVQIVSDLQTLSASFVVEKQMTAHSWIKVPCLGKVGSCSYDDFCAFVADLPTDHCQTLFGQDCKCPFKANEVKRDNAKFGPIPAIPSMLSGNFRITINAMETTAQKRAACYVLTASIA